MTTLANASYGDSIHKNGLAFLRQAAHDNRFRHELTSNPTAALAAYGFAVDQVPSSITLPAQQDIEKMLAFVDAENSSTSDIDSWDPQWGGFIG